MMEGWEGVWVGGCMNGWMNGPTNNVIRVSKDQDVIFICGHKRALWFSKVYGTSPTSGANREMFCQSMTISGFAAFQSLWKVKQGASNPQNVAEFGAWCKFFVSWVWDWGDNFHFYSFSIDQYDPNIKDINGTGSSHLGKYLIYHIFWQ